jgi:alkylated DNA repair dioxygenase AlkB
MDLFSDGTISNLLPYDGEAIYYGKIFDQVTTSNYLQCLLDNIEWKNDEAVIFGKRIITKRKTAWYGDKEFSYTYSNISRKALAWTKELLELKQIAEVRTGATYNSCLLNLYHDGNEGVSWHSDDEVTLKKHAAIASVSFGAARKFSFKHKKTSDTVSVLLESGSLMVMKGTTQTDWLHALPKSAKIKKARVNLTFRTIIQ